MLNPLAYRSIPAMIFDTARHAVIAVLLPALLVGCSTLSGGPHIKETELEIVPTESVASFSRSSQAEISSLALSADQLAAPTLLESLPSLTTLTPPGRRALIVAEAWYLRGQNDLEVPIATSLERYLRAAHFAYEGIFAGDACSEPQSQLCKDLYTTYNRAAREVARLTNNGKDLLAAEGLAYIVDTQGDRDPLTLQEWEFTLDDYQSPQTHPAFGASGAACQVVHNDGTHGSHSARTCTPVSLLVLFDARTDEPRSRAHIVAYDTFEHDALPLHGREVTLPTNILAAWNQIFTPQSVSTSELSCLGRVAPTVPSVVILPAPGQATSEWAAIASTLTANQALADHFNFCAATTPPSAEGAPLSDAIAHFLDLVAPQGTKPTQVVLISEGTENEQFVRALKQAVKEAHKEGSQSSPSIAGTLSLTAPHAPTGGVPAPPPTSASELSRHGTVALRDITRMLTKLADPEEGVFGSVSRSQLPRGSVMTLSPVM